MAVIGEGLFCTADVVQPAFDIAKPRFLWRFHKLVNVGREAMSFTLGKFRFLSRNSLFLQVTQIFSFLSFFIKYHLTKYAKCAAAFVSDEF